MQESCPNCGAELYGGQQFCRRCGTPVGSAVGGEAPTQLFGAGAQAGVAAPLAGTSPLGAGGGPTDSVAGQRPTEYHPQASQPTTALVGEPFGSRPLAVGGPPRPAPKRRGLWVAALLAVFVLGAGLASAAAFLWWRATHAGTVIRVVKTGPPPPGAPAPPDVPPIPDMPEIPSDLGQRIQEALKAHGVPLPLDESGAVVSGDDTTITRTFNLDSDGSFAAHVVAGNVTVVGSEDTDAAVVKVVKHGGSVQERAAARVLAAESEEGVTLFGAAAPGGPVSVSYEITVPRKGLGKLQLSTQKGDIKISEFDGDVDLNVANGSVNVSSNGAVHSRVVNGKTSVTYAGRHEEAQEFSVVNGDLEVSLNGEPEVDLTAASTNGHVEVDAALPLKADRRGSGQKVEAELGGGGAPLNVKVVNGNVRIRK
ncbi:MAG: DUF4097 family beta strand repeat protein [Acidobacteria bacterium]|nr:DUF4097 family beta strand repeat protein [Acidobacteriota bacterium]